MTVADCGHNVHGQNTRGFIDALWVFLDTPRRDGAGASAGGP